MKIIYRFIVPLVVFMLTTVSVSAQKIAPNERWMAAAYCLDEVSAKQLSEAVVERGVDGYNEIILSNRVNCWDYRLLKNVPVPEVTLIKKQWTIVSPQGETLEFWTAVDKNGFQGWVWFLLEEVGI